MKIFGKRVVYFLTAVLIAYGWFWLTAYIHFVISDGDMMTSTIFNFAIIIIVLIYEQIERYFYFKKKIKEQKRTIFSRFLDFWMYGASAKTALYLFYIYVLMCTAILAANPEFFYLADLSGVFQSAEYGILILLAGDVFLERLLKDIDKEKIS